MTSTAQLTVAVSTSGLATGTYNATVSITVRTWSTMTVPMMLMVSPVTPLPPSATTARALYHVTTRGHARQDIFIDDEDRQRFLDVLMQVVSRFHLLLHAYCLMDNHFHLVVETPDANLSSAMHQLNGV